MYKRHLHELGGQIDPKSGMRVTAYPRPINFEFQVSAHLRDHIAQLPDRPLWPTDLKAVERDIRRRLATGNAWLHTEPQMELFGE